MSANPTSDRQRLQARYLWQAFQPAVTQLEAVARIARAHPDVADASVICPCEEDILEDLQAGEAPRVPSLSVEVYRFSELGRKGLTWGLALPGVEKDGDGSGQFGTVTSFVLSAP